MAWFKVDDGFASHRKVLALRRGNERLRAIGLWTLAGALSARDGLGGRVPDYLLEELGATPKDVEALVRVGLWVRREDAEFHDWEVYNPDAATVAAQRAKESQSGALGNHRRWHVKRGITIPDCEFCHRVPDQDPDWDPESGATDNSATISGYDASDRQSLVSQCVTGLSSAGNGQIRTPERENHRGTRSEPDRVSVGSGIGSASPVPEPVPDIGANAPMRTSAAIERPEIRALCEHLADRIEANGSKRPTVGAKWLDACRLMLDRDGRTVDEIRGAIDWSQANEFWRGNVLSMPKLRDKYDQLRLQAQRDAQPRPLSRQQQTNDIYDRAAQRMGVQP